MGVALFWHGVALFLLTFLLTVLAELWLVPWLLKRRAGQPILEIGPSWHLKKAGTPTLGGLGFIFAILLSFGVIAIRSAQSTVYSATPLALCLAYALSLAGIGFFDDWCKLKKRENKGLSAWQKYLLQILAACAFLLLAVRFFGVDDSVKLPFITRRFSLGFFYYPLALLFLTGMANALNLTDGVDGLLSSTTAVFALLLLVMGLVDGEQDALNIGALLLGSTLGFLCFNRHPAKVFMGDTGSLFLGGMVGGYGVLSGSLLLVLMACGVFVIETLSVMLQVAYFKITKGRRLFRMAPLHHHFEKCGFSEWRVVMLFSFTAVFFAVLAFFGR